MASITTPHPHKLSFSSSNLLKLPLKRPFCPPHPPFSRASHSATLCLCSSSSSSSSSDDDTPQWRWDAAIQDVLRSAMRRFDGYMNSLRNEAKEIEDGADLKRNNRNDEGEEEEWDWACWRRHFDEVDEQEHVVSILKSQLGHAVRREDYKDAARLKVAIAAAATNDTVGRVMSHLKRALAEERYHDAASLRDNAGTGLVGWWSGISEDVHDPYGVIIRITAEHGRYVARSYSPRQLATAAVGVPLFEIFLTTNKKGEYKQQAVYLKRKGIFQDFPTISSKSSAASRLNPQSPTEGRGDLFVVSTEETDDADDTDSDFSEGLPGFQNILRDMIPGVKVKVLKVTAPAKVDRDFISKVIEQIMDEEDEDKDIELESGEAEDEIRGGSDEEKNEIELDAGHEIFDNEEHSEISVKVVVGGISQRLSGSVAAKESLRMPAKVEKMGQRSFSFSIEKDVNPHDSVAKEPTSLERKSRLQGPRSVDQVMFDLAKVIGREKIPIKVLKDVGELINLTLNQAQNRQQLSDSTTFHRIEISSSWDPLNGLYIGVHGLYTSEVIHIQRKFGQWQEDCASKEPSNLEFYEYVEAVKLTGDPYVPAGEVAFRAKVGKRYQLPHKGIIPEEFGVIARYKGQGRLAEPGYQNPRWVDGELVILDGKYIKGGPVVGFVYWAPEYHFLVFFNRLRLQ
ncbi:hypothetical protein K2173_009147 [Erythroxylum novogranatense]|uniref:Protein EXECUTER 1, chloroplastic n=1 Tax=Erythroxylum novogranatense TaxID=1862640 RepID=A0AAV8TEV4_9ROSI|nr:hypothetical protein K2173_009147 [Erythroxylum novogranatense]